jgi:hypothetical protein
VIGHFEVGKYFADVLVHDFELSFCQFIKMIMSGGKSLWQTPITEHP